ncbi:MAG: GntR family transcriptional regulator [Chloroflexi bacterium]|nr:GntR family transcriptional regulator [Chloroflexota bacterium]MBV9595622.1 GntR family transcriptional regulator [Chloroflexota bacterium]
MAIERRAPGPAAEVDARALAAAVHAYVGGVPLHSRLEGTLRGMIQQGQIGTGAVLPGELELAAQLGVSRHTVRHALGVLTNEGLLRRERGRGTTVVSASPTTMIERSLTAFYAFAWEARARGATQHSRILDRQTLSADPTFAERLGVPEGSELERIVRVRAADEDPLVLETAYLPQRLSSVLDTPTLERESMYDELERYWGLRVTGARESIRPIVLSRATARLLRTRTGAPAFSVERTTWSDRGPIEWQESIVRGDRYLYSVDLPRNH